MAGELQLAHGVTGRTLYAVLRSSTGTVYNTVTPGFEAYNASNWTSYDIALTEQGSSTYYVGNMPAVAAGVYSAEVRWQAGGSPAVTDTVVGSGTVEWSGTATNSLATIAAALPTRVTKNTALAGFMFFLADSSDHVSGKTGLTVTATRSLDGAAFAACANAVVEVSNGWYKIDLAAADLNGTVVALRFTATGADTRNVTIVTQPG